MVSLCQIYRENLLIEDRILYSVLGLRRLGSWQLRPLICFGRDPDRHWRWLDGYPFGSCVPRSEVNATRSRRPRIDVPLLLLLWCMIVVDSKIVFITHLCSPLLAI